MTARRITANETWTIRLVPTCFLSVQSLSLIPMKSTQKEVVNAVKAPSALGKAAEINPMIKNNPATGPRKCNAIVGNKSSEWAGTGMFLADAKLYNKIPSPRKRILTNKRMVLNVRSEEHTSELQSLRH